MAGRVVRLHGRVMGVGGATTVETWTPVADLQPCGMRTEAERLDLNSHNPDPGGPPLPPDDPCPGNKGVVGSACATSKDCCRGPCNPRNISAGPAGGCDSGGPSNKPQSLFNTMTMPLTQTVITGAIFYQGGAHKCEGCIHSRFVSICTLACTLLHAPCILSCHSLAACTGSQAMGLLWHTNHSRATVADSESDSHGAAAAAYQCTFPRMIAACKCMAQRTYTGVHERCCVLMALFPHAFGVCLSAF
jgi:hypothetical protein